MADSEGIRLTVDGLVFDGRVFSSPPDVTVIPVTVRVQTGLTHQRKDGERDQRYSVNPPTFDDRHAGYALAVGKEVQHDIDDPSSLAADIRRLAGFFFHRLKPKTAEWSRYPMTTQLTRILAEPASRCPRCQTWLRLRQGTIADRIPEPESPVQQEQA